MIESFLDSTVTQVWVPVGSLNQDIVKTHTKMPTGDGYKVKAAGQAFILFLAALEAQVYSQCFLAKAASKYILNLATHI